MNLNQLANNLINSTNCPIFLTGKAGTGKTTFLRHLTENTYKSCLITAPTGVAAINANGVTLHSLFQLPFGAFWPTNELPVTHINFQLTTPNQLIKQLKINKRKRELIQKAELLIIDEVSMVRADLLDAVDMVLRYVRRNRNRPFGGIQMLFIGDLLQLPPIVPDDEWELLKTVYRSPYFFDALVLKQQPPVYIEFEKVYRQTDAAFVDLLNHIRNNEITPQDINLLNQHIIPKFDTKLFPGFVFLTTHNHIADTINAEALANLNEPVFKYNARVTGDFTEYNYPVDYCLSLKKGAQVMFIKNDYSGNSQYFNGKIGVVSDIGESFIEVEFEDGLKVLADEYTWENKRFTLNTETNEIEEKVIGTFVHYPIRLAWAITIHKSQGLTFEKAVVDVGKAFTQGQVYVALSRLRNLEGLRLASKVPLDFLGHEKAVAEFSQQKSNPEKLTDLIKTEGPRFVTDVLIRTFGFEPVVVNLKELVQEITGPEKRAITETHIELCQGWLAQMIELNEVGGKFQTQIHKMAQMPNPNLLEDYQTRVKAASEYFTPRLEALMGAMKKLIDETKGQRGLKEFGTELKGIETQLYSFNFGIQKALMLVDSNLKNEILTRKQVFESDDFQNRLKEAVKPHKKKSKASAKDSTSKDEPTEAEAKTPTHLVTLGKYKEGLAISEIAKERGYVQNTIENHLARCIAEGHLSVLEFADQETMDWVYEIADELETTHLSPIKEIVLDDVTWTQLRMIMAQYAVDRGLAAESKSDD